MTPGSYSALTLWRARVNNDVWQLLGVNSAEGELTMTSGSYSELTLWRARVNSDVRQLTLWRARNNREITMTSASKFCGI